MSNVAGANSNDAGRAETGPISVVATVPVTPARARTDCVPERPVQATSAGPET